MLYFVDTVRALATSMRNAFRPPTTVEFPEVRRPRAERFRAGFALLHDEQGDELCVGCRACEKICPSQIITVEAEKRESPSTGKRRNYATVFTLDMNACIYCELCVQVCPTDAIVMTKLPEEPQYSRNSLCLNMPALYANEKRLPLAWANATRLQTMQDPKAGAAVSTESTPKPTEGTHD
jgi:NADH-quinone oxidoreductase subunit I